MFDKDDDNFLDVHALTVGREIHHTKEPGLKVDDDDTDVDNSDETGAQCASINGDLPKTTSPLEAKSLNHASHDPIPNDERQTHDSKNEANENSQCIRVESASNTVRKMDTMGSNELTVMTDPEAAVSHRNTELMDRQYADEPYLFDKDIEAWGLSRRKLILAFSILIILIVVALSVTICGVAKVCG
jgi:hypothetical protein